MEFRHKGLPKYGTEQAQATEGDVWC